METRKVTQKLMLDALKTLYQRLTAPRVFDRWAETYETDVTANHYSAAKAVAAAVEPYIGPDSLMTDLGVGTGLIWADMDLPDDVEITGLDFSANMLEQASAANPAIGPLYLCDVARSAWPIEDSSQDIVTAAGLFEYLTEPMATHVFAETHRTLKPGGVFIFTYIPGDRNETGVWNGKSGRVLSCRFAPEWLEAQDGFHVVRHDAPFKGSVYGDRTSYDYRLMVMKKSA